MKQASHAPYSSPEEQLASAERKLDELTDLVGGLMYDVGKLPFKFMQESDAARSLFHEFEKTGQWMRVNGYGGF